MRKGYNILAILEGSNYGTPSDNIIVIMAHYDTMGQDYHPTPGVNENGSGVAALLEIARLMKKQKSCNRYDSILFILPDKNRTSCKIE